MIELSTRDSMKSSLIKAEPQSSSSSLVLQVRSKPNTETLDESFSMAAAVSNDIKSSIAISGTLITGSSVLSTASESKTGVFHSEIDSVAQTPEKPASKTAHTKPTQATAVIQAAPSMNSSLYAQIALSSSLYEPIQTASKIANLCVYFLYCKCSSAKPKLLHCHFSESRKIIAPQMRT